MVQVKLVLLRICVVGLILFVGCGCWYSPWESCEYEIVNAPKTYDEAEKRLTLGMKDSKIANGIMHSAIITSSGDYFHSRGPYMLRLFFSKMENVNVKTPVVNIESVHVFKNKDFVYAIKEFSKELTERRVYVSGVVHRGEERIMLPDVFNPKTGDIIHVHITEQSKEGVRSVVSFDFIPKIKRGNWIPFN